jgi:predicted HicB family RNase H-like nuclease
MFSEKSPKDMAKNLVYKNYEAEVNYSAEDDVLYGRVLGINDLVAFDGDSLTELKKSFQEAMEAYLETCAHMGKQPEKSYKGVFNVRINPELHRKLAIRAQQEHTTLNKLVERSLEESIGAV